jgi:P27 family predicted phage terminase small subunit
MELFDMGAQGRKPYPSHLHVIRGNPAHQSFIKDEPQPAKPANLPDAPEYLTGYAVDEWRRMAAELYRLNLLTVVDVHSLALYCQAYSRWRTAEETLAAVAARDPAMNGLIIKTKTGAPMQNPLVLIAQRAGRDMMRFAAEFGFTPSARSRISTADSLGHIAATSKFGPLLSG